MRGTRALGTTGDQGGPGGTRGDQGGPRGTAGTTGNHGDHGDRRVNFGSFKRGYQGPHVETPPRGAAHVLGEPPSPCGRDGPSFLSPCSHTLNGVFFVFFVVFFVFAFFIFV